MENVLSQYLAVKQLPKNSLNEMFVRQVNQRKSDFNTPFYRLHLFVLKIKAMC